MGETWDGATMVERDNRRTLKVVAVWGAAVVALFYFGFKIDNPFRDGSSGEKRRR